jgi:hypothetical protein
LTYNILHAISEHGEESTMLDLKGKKVRVSMLAWEIDNYKPHMYEAIIADVSGTMFLFTEMVTFPVRGNVPDTWLNTSSLLFNFIQVIEENGEIMMVS